MDNQSVTGKELLEFFVKMHAENLTFARHHEDQRTKATTLFFGFPVVILTLGAVIWKDDLPGVIAGGLILIAFGGVALSLKLFERSAFHMGLANAYRESAEALLEDSARTALPPERLRNVGYVGRALGLGCGFERAGKNYRETKKISFYDEGPAVRGTGDRLLEDLNPAAPFTWVDPLHNQHAIYLRSHAARWDLYRIWAFMFGAVGALGLIVFVFVFQDDIGALVRQVLR